MKKSSTKKIIETILILLLVSLPIIIIYYLTEKEYNYIYLFCINLFLLGMLFIFYALKYYDNDDYNDYIVISKDEYDNMKNTISFNKETILNKNNQIKKLKKKLVEFEEKV